MTEPTPPTTVTPDPALADAGKQITVTDAKGSTVTTVVAPAAPSQVRHPWRSSARTVVQTGAALAAGLPLIYQSATQHSAAEATGGVGVMLGVCFAVTRVMGTTTVNGWLTRLGLGAEPKA